MTSSTSVSADLVAIAVRSIHAMASGERPEFDELYDPAATDLENPVQPPSSRVNGPDCYWSTAQWLREAFTGLHYDIHHAIGVDDLVVVNSTMNGEHTRPWVVYDESGRVDTVFPPTRRTFAVTQTHWFRMKDGRILEHWANRDDLGMARQLGWIPPSPAFLFRMARAKRKAVRAVR